MMQLQRLETMGGGLGGKQPFPAAGTAAAGLSEWARTFLLSERGRVHTGSVVLAVSPPADPGSERGRATSVSAIIPAPGYQTWTLGTNFGWRMSNQRQVRPGPGVSARSPC